jgi:DNA polymerase V
MVSNALLAVNVYPPKNTPDAPRLIQDVSSFLLPFVAESISAGFPSPANDYIESRIDLNEALIKNPSSTFLARVSGLSMQGAGIDEDDILIIDKSLTPCNGCIAVCCLDGDFTLKRIKIQQSEIWLVPENEQYKPIIVTPDNDFIVWGIVTYVIKKVQ